MLTTKLITTETELATLEAPWNALAGGEPLCSWNWLAPWWKYYGIAGTRELNLVTVYDNDKLIGIAPWFVEHVAGKGKVIFPLGSGHVCTDHLSLVCRPEDTDRVADAVADYLLDNDDWDRLELEAIDEGDPAIEGLMAKLEGQKCLVSRHRAGNCWVIDLPSTWDEYCQTISHSHRRQLKKCRKDAIESGRSKLHIVENHQQLAPAWEILVELHQRRRQSLGEPGCFASQAFGEYHREVVERLFAAGQLRLSWVEFDGEPFAAEYHITGPDTVYTYQSGMDTNRLHDSPGRLAYMLCLDRTIGDGYKKLDFMRGDEPYKAHFRAVAKPQFDYRVFPSRRLARLRGKLELAGASVKKWVKHGLASVIG